MRAGSLPAFWCRPSMFWVTSVSSRPLRSRSTSARCPSVGAGPDHMGEVRRFCHERAPQLGIRHVGLQCRHLLGLGVLGPQRPVDHESRRCPSPSKYRHRSAPRSASPVPTAPGPASRRRCMRSSPRGERSCGPVTCAGAGARGRPHRRAAARRRRRGSPAPRRRCPARRRVQPRRPGRVRPRVVGRPHMRRPRCRPHRAHPRHAQRHPDRHRARRPRRRRPPRGPHLHRGRAARAHKRGTSNGSGPVPADPTDALHVGYDGPAEGRHDGTVGRRHGQSRRRGRGRRLALRSQGPAHGVLADVPHRVHPVRRRHAPGGRLPRHPQPLRRAHRARCPPAPPAPPRPSSSPRTCSAFCRAPTLAPTRCTSTRCASSPTPGRPVPTRSSAPSWNESGPAASGSSTAPPRPSSRCVHRRTGSSARAPWAAPVRAAASRSSPVPSPRSRTPTPRTATATSAPDSVRHHLVRHARVRPLQLLGGPRRHGRRLERVGVHRR